MNTLIKKEIYVPRIIEENKRKHTNPKEWINMYYYIDKKRTKAKINKNIVTSKTPIRKNNFYKITSLSKKDAVFDYYKILKPEFQTDKTLNEIAVINNLKNSSKENTINTYPKSKKIDNSWKGKKIPGLQIINKPFTLHF